MNRYLVFADYDEPQGFETAWDMFQGDCNSIENIREKILDSKLTKLRTSDTAMMIYACSALSVIFRDKENANAG